MLEKENATEKINEEKEKKEQKEKPEGNFFLLSSNANLTIGSKLTVTHIGKSTNELLDYAKKMQGGSPEYVFIGEDLSIYKRTPVIQLEKQNK